MGQYANQPDFATRAVGPITPDIAINQTTFLDSAAIYVGNGGNLKVIMAGTVGPSVVTGAAGLGYQGSNGTGYPQGPGRTIAKGVSTSGTGLQFNTTGSPDGSVQIDSVFAAGSGYKNGDIIFLDSGNKDALFRVIAEAGFPTSAEAVEFMNIQSGSFVPVIVDYVLPATATAAQDLVAVY